MTYDVCQYNTENAENFKFVNKHGIHFMWYPATFSQSRLGNTSSKGSNACTIIALLMATNINTSNIRVNCLFTSPAKNSLTELFTDAILNGNAIHQNLFKNSSSSQNTNLTVPEAMKAGESSLGTMAEWKSSVYFNDIKINLYAEMNRYIIEWYTNPPCCQPNNLYIILIAHNKAILIVIQLDTNSVLLIDSHQHSSHGALICQSRISKLENLCVWYSKMLCDSAGSNPNAYELSFLYFKCEKRNNKKHMI
ncbi:uncharacterized protein LOC114122463 isoform X1 [Aphis gossypii]|uniref:Uncharacterized protein n=2 Tax=Aphis gossypii TaxID=80765 RepID=A0A9P0JJ27_APHGO|nr:uncharacterized protein LOC114122463 isoform X1 [Aphis gossypii]CAH1738846.1 unnamed protein product [Aphis gossypii]